MSDFVDKTAVDDIVLSSGRTVQVRQRLGALEQARFQREMLRLKVDVASGTVEVVDTDWHLQRINVCKAYLVSWDMRGLDNEIMPYRPELVEVLPDETVSEIAEAIDRAQRERRGLTEKKGGPS